MIFHFLTSVNSLIFIHVTMFVLRFTVFFQNNKFFLFPVKFFERLLTKLDLLTTLIIKINYVVNSNNSKIVN
ncbi:hypothetical protein D1970_10095 [Mesobacillus zeae]|uniref:Uncharacterized protein n=1 Tax=Mesobacillus zeae TaxID=1917180 RepID=A0A398B8P5_9BACI|nr:hypothetical protein D1970_10095 [Mesobacillus zeae]